MKIVEKSILSTDLAMYFRKKDKFIELVDNGEISWQGEDKKDRKFLTVTFLFSLLLFSSLVCMKE